MSASENLAHTVAAYSLFEQHRISAVVLIVLAFVPHFKLTNVFKVLLRGASSWCSVCALLAQHLD